ncbi:hypothetical protein NEUTE1DRAFT_98745 [Neurospora tetrasperma FGSC 2508]|uniref:Rhodopsin domain-containing protein n=1 Tax=Neurospora tetrasperma (strain FGSC 2508 / ATCC MYA-4615 / P0657) TaxID=510951 RepID=F8MEN9_NEUT8|nr:uncharacterized protein NEUTE1DRAFT_98745 [Neurospora tetrasperma FGSC 2508]EGO61668.1 hypothetical protein NEUTE1DRAFT_98745 [Neurospora tetrasperma FGSC 2508]
MWFLSSVVLFTIVSYGATALQPRTDSDILALYPECATQSSKIVSRSTSSTNLACNPAMTGHASALTNSVPSGKPSNITTINCHLPTRDRSALLLRENIALLVSTLLLTTLRTLYKLFVPFPAHPNTDSSSHGFSRPPSQYLPRLQRLHADDYALISITLLGLPNLLLAIFRLHPLGVGQDAWTLPLDNIAKTVRYGYGMGVVYFLQVALTKVVFLLFYLRIFPGKVVRRVLWATLSVCVLFGLGSAIAGVLQCTPVRWWFEGWDYREGIPGGDATWEGWGEDGGGRRPGRCINRKAFHVAAAVISISIDIWMLAIPLWCIRGLRMSVWKKMGVVGMFGIGMLVTIFSCIRLRELTVFTETPNPTQALFDVDRWSTLEAASSIFCACMPTLRQMVVSVVSLGRRRFGKRGSSSGGSGKVGSSSTSTVALGINSRYSRSTENPNGSQHRFSDTPQEKLPDTEQPVQDLSHDMSENHDIRSGNSSIMYTVEYSVEVDNSPASAITPESGRLSPPPYTYGNGPQDPPGVNDNCENYRACVVSRNLGRIGGGGGSLRRQSMSPRLRVVA